ncbi:MAG TPA: hypothetical protein VII01_04940, partial [Solirubrobacteraceae bacterium]
MFVGTGAMGTAYGGLIGEFAGRRTSAGWETQSAIPRQLESLNILSTEGPNFILPSEDFSSFLFGAFGLYVSAEPFHESSSANIFLSRDPSVEPTWVARPTTPNVIPLPGHNSQPHDYLIAGTSQDLSTAYFTYSGTLVPEDASRAPFVGDGQSRGPSPWGLYEWDSGRLRAAGILPNGTLSPLGAVPAAIAASGFAERANANVQAQLLDNEVSTDGRRVFFVSPDPVASPPQPPQLYVRETLPDGGRRSVLVSASAVPGHVGEPAPHGPLAVADAESSGGASAGSTYVFASPDGSHAFFQSVDRLTEEAPEDQSPKTYEFDIDTGTLTYLNGVSGAIAAVASDGSSVLFESRAAAPLHLKLWRAGVGGGTVREVATLPEPPSSCEPFKGEVDVSGARASADGSTYVFRTNAPIPEGFNNGGGYAQVYRYAVASNALGCASCPPPGVLPSGDAHVSYDNTGEGRSNGSQSEPMSTIDTRVVSADGSRVFFDTPDPLAAQDTNGVRDVYEWEAGHQYLISSGKSLDNSYVLDSSASGGDIFFTTDFGFWSGDADNAYDVYDARIPRAGDNPPQESGECGAACRAPVAAPALPGTPASATFEGSGNLEPALVAPTPRRLTPATVRAHRLG